MRSRSIIFLAIAFIHFLSKLFTAIFSPIPAESVVIPGWHTTIEYKVAFMEWFTALYFVAIAVIYTSEKARNFSRLIFWFHVVVSIAPLMTYTMWFLTVSRGTYEFEDLFEEFRIIKVLEWLFLISQALFLLLMLGKSNFFSRQYVRIKS